MDACETCEEAPWCRDARDPRPLTGPTPGAMAGGDAAFEAAEHEPHQAPVHDADATTQFSLAARAILDACEFNPARVVAIMFRLAGLSYEAIGQSLATVRPGKSRQAVLKDLRAIEAKNPSLGKLARTGFSRPMDPRSANALLTARYLSLLPKWKGPKQGAVGLFALLAAEVEAASWNSVRVRVGRTLKRQRKVAKMLPDNIGEPS